MSFKEFSPSNLCVPDNFMFLTNVAALQLEARHQTDAKINEWVSKQTLVRKKIITDALLSGLVTPKKIVQSQSDRLDSRKLQLSINNKIDCNAASLPQSSSQFQSFFDTYNVPSNSELSKTAQVHTKVSTKVGLSLIDNQCLELPSVKKIHMDATTKDFIKQPFASFMHQSCHPHFFFPDSGSHHPQQKIQDFPLALENLGLPPESASRRKGRPATFLNNLYQMFMDIETHQQQHPELANIATFLPHGRAFAIRKPKEFVEHVIPTYFRMSSFPSFQRQLNMYGFRQIIDGPYRGAYGAYYHPLFMRGQPQLLQQIKRVQKSSTKVTK